MTADAAPLQVIACASRLPATPCVFPVSPLQGRNLIHGSDSPASAEAEIKLWFPEGLAAWTSHSATWIYE